MTVWLVHQVREEFGRVGELRKKEGTHSKTSPVIDCLWLIRHWLENGSLAEISKLYFATQIFVLSIYQPVGKG